MDLTLGKKFPVKESKWFEFRAEAFNVTNTPAFQGPGRNINSATFGEVASTQGERNVQLALKFYF